MNVILERLDLGVEPAGRNCGIVCAAFHGPNAPTPTAQLRQLGVKLVDHLVGAGEQQCRHFDAERLGSLEIYHQFELGWLFNRQMADILL